MRLRKWRKISLVFLMGIVGLLLMVFLVLNLPFSQRFATGKVNQILSSSGVPIHLDAIRKIMPGSVNIQGIVISGTQGDTIIYVGELQADIRLISLIRSKVMLKEVLLDGVLVELVRKSGAEKLNIAAAFQSGKKKAVPLEKPPAKWEISIKKGALTNIHFLMQDSLGGIHIAEDASEIELGSFLVSLPAREISCKTLFLGEADGLVNLTPRMLPPRKHKGSPWNLGFQKLVLDDVDFIFSQAEAGLRLETSIGKGSIKANEIELVSRTADFELISLDKSMVTIQTGSASKKPKKQKNAKEDSSPWNLRSEDIEISKSALRLGSDPLENFKELDVRVEDLRLDKDQAGMKLKKIGFEMGNGFTLKKMSGEIDSNSELTRLQLEINSGNSRMRLEGMAEAGYQEIFSAPEAISKGALDMELSQISLRDLSYFVEDLDSLAFYTSLAASQIDMSARLNIEGPLFTLSECSVSQEKNFKITLEGRLNNPLQFSDATGDLDLEISGLDQAWMQSFADGIGIFQEIPELSDLKILGNISDSLKSPDISLELKSQSGNVDLEGSFDFQKEFFMLAYSFRKLALGELLSMPELRSFTGAGEIKGRGFSGENLNASYYLQIDTLRFHGYEYSHTQLTGTIEPGVYELQMVANDSSLKADLNLTLNLADSAMAVKVSGYLHAQLNKLHLVQDTLAVETVLDASLIHNGKELRARISAEEIAITTPWETAVIPELNANFNSDSLSSRFHADADFFHVDLNVAKPINALDSLGEGYKHYFASFLDASHLTATDRVSDLPEISASAHISYHELFNVFVEDKNLRFENLDVSIIKESEQNSLRAYVRGDEMFFKMIEAEKLNAVVTDSAGTIFMELIADSTSIFSGPEYKWALRGEFSNRRMLTELSVDDYQDQNIYHIEVAGKVDSSQILLEIPSQQLVLNKNLWQLEQADLLSIDLATNTYYPMLQMKRDSSYLHMNTQIEDQFITYKLSLNQVELGSLIRNEVFTGNPDGTFTGFLDFATNRESEKKIATELQISDVSFSGHDLSDIRLDGGISWEQMSAYKMELNVRSDSAIVRLNAGRTEGGDMDLEAAFSNFHLHTVEPFTTDYVSELGGTISGKINASSQGGDDQIDGELIFQDARLKVNMLNSAFRIPAQHIVLADEKMIFDNFTVLDTLNRPLRLDGFIDFGNFKQVMANLNVTSSELQVMSRDKESQEPFTGNIFLDSRVSIEGPLANPDIGGSINLSKGSEIFYHYMEDFRVTETGKVVNFVDHSSSDKEITTAVLDQQTSLMSSSIETIIEIDPSTLINFTLAKRMFDIDLNVKGGGKLQYNQENEQMSLSGIYEVGEGSTLLKLVGWPDKTFRLVEGGFIRWDGRIENPELKLEAENKVSTSYLNPIDGKNRAVDFYVILRLSDFLSDLNVLFTIRTPDQYVMSIINALSPEEQMRQAISVLLFETVDLPGISSSTDYMTQQVNQIISSQMNQLTKTTIKGVDISFGLDTYDQSYADGSDQTNTSLSYEVSKSLLNNRAQIELSGRFNNDNQQTGTTSDHSLNNVSFEYTLDSAATQYLKVYNEHTYDDVFVGEVIQTGIGFSYRKRYETLKDIWKRKK